MSKELDEFLAALTLVRTRQSDSALSGKGYQWPLALNITVRTFSDLSPSATVKYGDRVYEGGFITVLEKATEWLTEAGK
jgi:hypothetical protein